MSRDVTFRIDRHNDASSIRTLGAGNFHFWELLGAEPETLEYSAGSRSSLVDGAALFAEELAWGECWFVFDWWSELLDSHDGAAESTSAAAIRCWDVHWFCLLRGADAGGMKFCPFQSS